MQTAFIFRMSHFFWTTVYFPGSWAYDPRSGSVAQGHQENWAKSMCTSYGEECTYCTILKPDYGDVCNGKTHYKVWTREVHSNQNTLFPHSPDASSQYPAGRSWECQKFSCKESVCVSINICPWQNPMQFAIYFTRSKVTTPIIKKIYSDIWHTIVLAFMLWHLCYL